MTSSPVLPALRLAAIDLDGTLLGADLTISSENRRGLDRLRERGVEVVIATGRHYASIRPFLASLPMVNWLVSFQGAEVSDRERTTVLARHHLQRHEIDAVLAHARQAGGTYLAYSLDGILTDLAPNPDLDYYARLSGLAPQRVEPAELVRYPIFKILWIAAAEPLQAALADPHVGAGLEKVRTHHRILEFIPAGVTKASGLAALAQRLNIAPNEVATFGDAENDIPMFAWSGRSFAMAHGWPAAIAAAAHVTAPGPQETALSRAIDVVLAETP